MEYSDLQWANKCARPVTAKLIGRTDLLAFIKTNDPQMLILHAKNKMKCAFPHLGLVSFCNRQLDIGSWSDLSNLSDTYHKIHRLARKNSIDLFPLPGTKGNKYDNKQRI